MASSSGAGESSSNGMSAEDQMRDEIARLTATINQHKSGQLPKPPSSSYNPYSYGGYRGRGRGRGGAMMGGSGSGPHKQYVRPGLVAANSTGGKGKENASAGGGATAGEASAGVGASEGGEEKAQAGGGRKEVVIGGVAFEASKRSLVRKDLATTKPKTKKAAPHSFTRKGPPGHLVPRSRMYKPKGRNMTLDNTGRTYTHSRPKKATIRKIDKPCSRFTKTGTCSRGLTCPYQHDPTKIAICWKFMQGDCPETADTCNLSHNPTPERTPLCVHFLNRGRCTKEKCLFPHVNVGKKEGVCKDFAVLGYCEKGVECDKNHVRECPEFEETGECRTRGCKLPHVIKANAKWAKKDKAVEEKKMEVAGGIDVGGGEKVLTAPSGNLGDEYISLIFNESDESESSDGEEEEEEEEEGEEEEPEPEEMEVHA
ncbi:hypothetical protein D9756_002291 [Leucocoprinus leucothites]|uniref:C3H1-type domain-containing protein n=1 Tax=Leucocoprinus leucothites TaxID=201217 RepID=A0A8H5GCM4_9AGAR|nr:hypothetical protein D9756_002291 [Leucoagaricus leucothites]